MWRFVAWQLYWAFVIGLFCIAYWRSLPEVTLLKIEEFISNYSSTILGIGTVVLISLIGLLTTIVSISFQERREASNRRVQAELKISEYRQAWIIELRDDITKVLKLFYSKGMTSNFEDQELDDIFELMSRINLKLNFKEPKADTLWKALNRAFESAVDHDENVAINVREASQREIHNHLAKAAREFLKHEWDRLKRDLEHSQMISKV